MLCARRCISGLLPSDEPSAHGVDPEERGETAKSEAVPASQAVEYLGRSHGGVGGPSDAGGGDGVR